MEGGPQNDAVCWFVFIFVLSSLLAVDLTYHAPSMVQRITHATANRLASFWFGTGLAFNLFILAHLGWEASSGFMQGFFLEYMLSFDNLFVFHMIFSHYVTPDALLYRALYFGIAGAIVFRIIIISVGYSLVNTGVYFVKFCFGAVLIYTGYKSAFEEEEDADVSKNQCVAFITKVLPISDHYEPRGYFFMDVEDRAEGPRTDMFFERARQIDVRDRANSLDGLLSTPSIDSESAVANLPRLESFEGSSLLRDASRPRDTESRERDAPSHDPPDATPTTVKPDLRYKRVTVKASLLLLVVVALWAADFVFAMDSVASKLASVNDIFLNVSSSAFAMLGLRSLYFVMENMLQDFHMLKYGVAAVLVLIGLKMMLSIWFEISGGVTFVLVIGICIASAASSYWLPSVRQSCTTFAAEDEVLETVPEGEENTILEQVEELEPMTPSRPVALPVRFEDDVA